MQIKNTGTPMGSPHISSYNILGNFLGKRKFEERVLEEEFLRRGSKKLFLRPTLRPAMG